MLRQLAARLCGGEGQHVYRYATAWPVEMLLAQSWDTALLEEVGAAVAAAGPGHEHPPQSAVWPQL